MAGQDGWGGQGWAFLWVCVHTYVCGGLRSTVSMAPQEPSTLFLETGSPQYWEPRLMAETGQASTLPMSH